MPNYCDCELVIYCDDKTVTKSVFDTIAKIRKDKLVFDFNTLIPYPEEYKRLDDLATKAEEHGERIKDGYNSGGYEWCCKNWGTKWNACDSKVIYHDEEELKITFKTAWSPCYPVIDKLAEMFPQTDINFEWFEMGMQVCGSAYYREGKQKDIAESKYYGSRGG